MEEPASIPTSEILSSDDFADAEAIIISAHKIVRILNTQLKIFSLIIKTEATVFMDNSQFLLPNNIDSISIELEEGAKLLNEHGEDYIPELPDFAQLEIVPIGEIEWAAETTFE